MFIDILTEKGIGIIEPLVLPICGCCARPWCDYHKIHFEDCICSRPRKMNISKCPIESFYFTDILTFPLIPDICDESCIAVISNHVICLHCCQSIHFNNSNLFLNKVDIIRIFFDIHESCGWFRQVHYIT